MWILLLFPEARARRLSAVLGLRQVEKQVKLRNTAAKKQGDEKTPDEKRAQPGPLEQALFSDEEDEDDYDDEG